MRSRRDHPRQGWLLLLALLGWVYALLSSGIAASSAAEPPQNQSPSTQATTADSLYQQGIQHFRAGQLQPAIQAWQSAQRLYRQQQNLKAIAQTWDNLGMAFRTLGDYTQAIAAYQQQFALVQQLNDRPAIANVLANLGSIYRILGNYQEALRFTQRSLELRRVLNDRPGEGLVLANLGNIQAELGKYETAIDLHQRSLAISQEVRDWRGVVLSFNSLGALYAGLGEYRKAQQHYEASLRTAQTIHFPAAAGSAFSNLGFVLHAQGHYDQAIAHYQQSLTIAQQLNDARMVGTALAGLGLGYTSLADYAQALTYQQQSLHLAQKIGDRKLAGLTLSNMAYTLWRSGDLARAEQQYRAALATLESLRLHLNDPDKVSIIDTQMVSYNNLLQVLIARQQPAAALEVAERSRARAFVELLSRRFGARAKGHEQQGTLAEYPPPTLAQIRQIAKTQNATLIEYAIVPDSHFIAHGKLKGADVALLIWVVQPNGNIHFRQVDLTPLHAQKLSLTTLVKITRNCLHPSFDCRSHLGDGSPPPPAPRKHRRNLALQRLHQLLIQPIADLLPTDPEQRVIVIPQAALFLVPFPALQDATGAYLVEHHTLLTVPSIQVLDLTRQVKQRRQMPRSQSPDRAAFQGRSPAPRLTPALIVGNPLMPEVNGQPLAALPAAETEANQIADLLQTKALIGRAAHQAAIVQQMPQARLIHLATHGLLDYGQSLGETDIPGAIALAPTPAVPGGRPGSNGILTASKIFDLRLQADLVVLSACDTGQGRITGDGVIGLSRAFIAAGVPSLIVSLWAVSDTSSADLMVTFYQHWLQQPDKARALRQSMLKTMQNYPRPIDWAAFTLVGEAE